MYLTAPNPTPERAAARMKPGTRLARRYRVRRFLAEGAASEVYEAEDEYDSVRVALKVVRPPLDDTTRALEAFELEAAAYARIDSPHVPKLYRLGTLRGRSRFMVLELLSGDRLSERLTRGPLSIPAVLDLGCQLLSALHAVHSAGLIHCDVKPQNLIVEGEYPELTRVRLVDFGISTVLRKGHRFVGSKTSRAVGSKTSTVVGTPDYMSPEQARGEPVDLRTDIYSAGVVLYQAVTGRLPFTAANDREVLLAKLRDAVVPPRVLRDSCPIELERVLMRSLCRNRRYRFSAAHRVIDELEWIRDRYGLSHAWTPNRSVHPPGTSTPLATTRPVTSVSSKTDHR